MTDWNDDMDAAPLDEPVLLTVGWPGQERTVVGAKNISSDGRDFGQTYFWIYGPQGGARATETYIGVPTAWARMPPPSLTK